MRLTPHPSRATAALLGLALTLSSQAALAGPSAQLNATMSNFSMSVIDMTPDDGIAADYSLVPGSSSNMALSLISHGGITERIAHAFSDSDTPVDSYLAQTGLRSTAQAGRWGDLQANSSLNANAGADLLDFSTGSEAVQYFTVLVAPHTQFAFGGHTDLSISETGQRFGGVNNFAATSISFNGSEESFSVNTGDFPHSGSVSEDFSYSYLNDGATEQYVWLEMRVRTGADYYAAITPVPEPASYAMFGLGALLVGAITRRQRRQRPAA
ncbi:MAG: PEP-CTERM sorting domain-containing protein [Pseudomonadota bacterium]